MSKEWTEKDALRLFDPSPIMRLYGRWHWRRHQKRAQTAAEQATIHYLSMLIRKGKGVD